MISYDIIYVYIYISPETITHKLLCLINRTMTDHLRSVSCATAWPGQSLRPSVTMMALENPYICGTIWSITLTKNGNLTFEHGDSSIEHGDLSMNMAILNDLIEN